MVLADLVLAVVSLVGEVTVVVVATDVFFLLPPIGAVLLLVAVLEPDPVAIIELVEPDPLVLPLAAVFIEIVRLLLANLLMVSNFLIIPFNCLFAWPVLNLSVAGFLDKLLKTVIV